MHADCRCKSTQNVCCRMSNCGYETKLMAKLMFAVFLISSYPDTFYVTVNSEITNVQDACVSQFTKGHCRAHTQTRSALVYLCITTLAADRLGTGELRRVWVNICVEAVTPSCLRGSRMARAIIDVGLCSVSSHKTPMIIDDSGLVLFSRCLRCG